MSSALKKSKLSDVNHFFCFLYKINISEIRGGVFFLMTVPKIIKIFSHVLSSNLYSMCFTQPRVISATQLSPTLRKSTVLQSHL